MQTFLIHDKVTSPVAAPTAADDGFEIPKQYRNVKRAHFFVTIDGTSGAWTAAAEVWGHVASMVTPDDPQTPLDGGWFRIFKTGDVTVTSKDPQPYPIEWMQDYDRLAIAIPTLSGTGTKVTGAIGLPGDPQH